MSDFMVWSIILIADFFCILLGIYAVFRIVSIFMNKGDLMKSQAYFITAFLCLILFPMIITIGGLNIAKITGLTSPMIGITVKTDDITGVNDLIKIKYNKNYDSLKDISLSISNKLNRISDLNINISCVGSTIKCGKVKNSLVYNQNKIQVPPKSIIDLPIKINFDENVPREDYDFNITVFDSNGNMYDSVLVSLYVE